MANRPVLVFDGTRGAPEEIHFGIERGTQVDLWCGVGTATIRVIGRDRTLHLDGKSEYDMMALAVSVFQGVFMPMYEKLKEEQCRLAVENLALRDKVAEQHEDIEEHWKWRRYTDALSKAKRKTLIKTTRLTAMEVDAAIEQARLEARGTKEANEL